MLAYIKAPDPALCCGCRTCEQICVQKALHFEEDTEGFLYPILNKELCVDCGLYEKVCPMMNAVKTQHEEIKAYFA